MTTKHKHHVLAASMLDVISGTGTGIAAGAQREFLDAVRQSEPRGRADSGSKS